MRYTVTPQMTLYYNGVDGRFIPCRFIDRPDANSIRVRITATIHGYNRHDVLTVPLGYVFPARSRRWSNASSRYYVVSDYVFPEVLTTV